MAISTQKEMRIASTAVEYEAMYRQWQRKTIALVPTMGALHEGHAALIRRARELADIVVVSIFVNPLQFGPKEDLSRYPRPKEQDLALCQALGADAVFHPTVETMYPDGMENVTKVIPPSALTDHLCGAYRPGHFTGVATVVLKLFNLIRPTMAVFGEKDAQQLAIIRKMVNDLQVPVELIGYPIVRDADGLALSSRNSYLKSGAEKNAALLLSRILRHIADETRQSVQSLPARETMERIVQSELEKLQAASGDDALFRLQYLEAVDAKNFKPAEALSFGVKLLIAAYVGDVRLIDNLDIG